MYFLPAIRGKGLAKKLALMAMEQAREMGFKRCYLETTAFLKEAIALYEHLGFEHIDYALGCTGHVDCEVPVSYTHLIITATDSGWKILLHMLS